VTGITITLTALQKACGIDADGRATHKLTICGQHRQGREPLHGKATHKRQRFGDSLSVRDSS